MGEMKRAIAHEEKDRRLQMEQERMTSNIGDIIMNTACSYHQRSADRFI